MFRIILLAAAVFSAAGAASAATFEAQAQAQFDLVSALFTPSGGDALSSLVINSFEDNVDVYPEKRGRASVDAAFLSFPDGVARAETSGEAREPFGSASGSVRGWYYTRIDNHGAEAVDLTFAYTGAVTTATDGALTDAFASVEVWLGNDDATIFSDATDSFGSETIGGFASIRIAPGETAWAVRVLNVTGSAFAFSDDPAPVPLPGALPLLAGGAGLLGLFRRRRG